MGTHWNPGLTAPLQRACEKCTHNKRKCDKARPKCSRCQRLDAICLYSYDPIASDTSTSHQDPYIQDAVPGFVLFQDESGQLRSLLVATSVDWSYTLYHYFHTIHHWFKILSKDKLEKIMQCDLDRGQPDTQSAGHNWLFQGTNESTLLAACIYLLTLTDEDMDPDGGMFSPLYRATKRAFAALSCLASPTVGLIQCGALISLFEFGHGRSHFSYRTLSETLAMARISGIKPGACADLNNQAIADRMEDDRRDLWWGIFMLDQYIHMDPDATDLPLLVEAPEEDHLLPTEGVIWNGHSRSSFEARVPVNGDVHIQLGAFQRAAQAAALLNKVHRWEKRARQRSELPPVADFEDMDKTIRSMLNAMLAQCDGWGVLCDAFAMCLSALFILYRPYLLPRKSPTSSRGEQNLDQNDRNQAVAVIGFGIRFVVDLCLHFNKHFEENPSLLANLTPPAAITCCQALEYFMFSGNVFENEKEGVFEIYKALKVFGKRWKIGETELNRIPQTQHLEEWAANLGSTL